MMIATRENKEEDEKNTTSASTSMDESKRTTVSTCVSEVVHVQLNGDQQVPCRELIRRNQNSKYLLAFQELVVEEVN